MVKQYFFSKEVRRLEAGGYVSHNCKGYLLITSYFTYC